MKWSRQRKKFRRRLCRALTTTLGKRMPVLITDKRSLLSWRGAPAPGVLLAKACFPSSRNRLLFPDAWPGPMRRYLAAEKGSHGQPPRSATIGLASAPQSMAHHRDGDDGGVHGGAGHVHRQHRAAAYRRRSFGHAGRGHLGSHQLSRLQCHRAAHDGVARQLFRTQAGFPRRCLVMFTDRLPRCAVWRGIMPTLVIARILQGASAAAQMSAHCPGDHARKFPAAKARRGHGILCAGRGRGAHPRPNHRRLDHRQLFLALDFLHQPARRARSLSC